jgi:hypothetical protein
MKALNTKDLFSFVTDQMHKLDEGLISVDQAKAQSSLLNQANNILAYELKRAKLIAEHGDKMKIREVENL